MENDLGRVVDALPGLVWTALPDGRIDFVNSRWCDYTGLVADDICGHGWQAAVHPEDLPGLLERWRTILASGVPGEMEARLRRWDGAYRWFLLRTSALSDASGTIVKWCGVSTDNEEQKRAEEDAQARERRYRMIVDGLPTMVTLMQPNGLLFYANRQVMDYFGATMDELKGWVSGSTFHPGDASAALVAWKDSVDTGSPYVRDARQRRADGVYRWFHMHGFPVRDAEGRIDLWYLLQTDIDDRKHAEALLAGEKSLLEMVARGRQMPDILDALCRFVEAATSGCYCSVVLVDQHGTRLEHGAAPSLPASFIASVVGRAIDVESGPCAMAACLNEQVIAADLKVEMRWESSAWCSMAIAHGLQACWSIPITSAAGKVLGAFAIYYDEPKSPTALHQSLIEQLMHIASIVVEHAQADAVLKRSEAGLRAIVETTPECVKVLARDGTVLGVNSAGVAMAGAPSAEVVIGQCFYDFLAPEHRARYREFNDGICSGQKGFLEFDIIDMQGERRQMETHAAPMRHSDGSIVHLGVSRDITHRKLSEQKLLRSEAFLAEAQRLSSSGSFAWRLDPDEFIWSEELYRIFEFERGTPVTLDRIATRYHPEDAPVLSDMIRRATSDGSDWEYEHRLLMPDQSIKYLHVVAHSTRGEHGRLEYIGAVQDVTERRQSEEALGKVRSELAHVARITTLGALTASIAHEVNQPLSGIITNASTCLRMLAADPPNVDGALETARRTIRDGNRASEVVARLRALFSKKGTTTEVVDLNDATREVIALSLSDLQRSRVVLQPELADDLPSVTGDRVQLQQVILNLLRNASDAMSSIDDRPRQLVVRTQRDADDCVRLAVSDAGVGFEPQVAERLFEAFYTTKSEGMGMGLSISRSIIENHRGRLWAFPNEGPGATFAFSIPRELGNA